MKVAFISMFSAEWAIGEGSKWTGICNTGVDIHIKV